jgi:hypothetical protein
MVFLMVLKLISCCNIRGSVRSCTDRRGVPAIKPLYSTNNHVNLEEDLSSRKKYNTAGMVVHSNNPSTQVAEAEDLKFKGSLHYSVRPYL